MYTCYYLHIYLCEYTLIHNNIIYIHSYRNIYMFLFICWTKIQMFLKCCGNMGGKICKSLYWFSLSTEVILLWYLIILFSVNVQYIHIQHKFCILSSIFEYEVHLSMSLLDIYIMREWKLIANVTLCVVVPFDYKLN